MTINNTTQFQGDIEQYIADELLPVAQRYLVIHQMGDEAELPEGRGLSYTATRFNRVPLPQFPLAEGVPPVGETMTISQVTGTALQWGDGIRLTDVAELTTKHPLMKTANQLLGLQVGELFERNTFQTLLAATQVNYVNQRGSRAAIQASDVLDPHTINRTVAALENLGAYQFMGPSETDPKLKAGSQAMRANKDFAGMPHFVAIGSPLVFGDFSENSTFILAASYSDINKLYNSEIGSWRGMRFCKSNLVPTWTGIAAVNGTAGTSGSLATGTYYIQLTASDVQNQYESQIYQVSASIPVTGPSGSVSVTLPNLTGYVFSAYIGTSASPQNLALSSSGPPSGPMAGQATQMVGGQTVVLTGVGIAQVPPAAPATGVTVYPTYVIGKGYFTNIKLKSVEVFWNDKPDKTDWLNQLRIVGWKTIYGTMISNQQFGCRIESSSGFPATFG
jgi:N4-gp56 family major capsid protein